MVKTRLQSSVANFEPITQCSSVPGASDGGCTNTKPNPFQNQHLNQRIHHHQGHNGYHHHHHSGAPGPGGASSSTPSLPSTNSRRPTFVIWRCLKHIYDTEGPRALFKGLGPNLIGVAPSRAIYFCTYSTVKGLCNEYFTVSFQSPLRSKG